MWEEAVSEADKWSRDPGEGTKFKREICERKNENVQLIARQKIESVNDTLVIV